MPIRLSEFEERMVAVSAGEWRSRLAAGESLTAIWVVSGSATVAEVLGASGADCIVIDAEHSEVTASTVVAQIRALDTAPVFTIVRAPSRDASVIGRLLDLGVRGLMVPMVRSGAEAEAVVAATRYPPRGTRGVGGGFARATRWNQVSDYLEESEASAAVIAQIETVESVEAIPEILAVDGIAAAFVGPADLAASMGHLGQPRHPAVQEVVDRAIRSIVAHGGVAGVNAFGVDDALRYRDAGARFLAVAADVTLLTSASAQLLARFAPDPPA